MHTVLHSIKIVGSIKCTLCSKLEDLANLSLF